MKPITSAQNRYVKLARSLSRPKGRKESGSLLLEGVRLVEDALLAGAEFDLVLYRAGGEGQFVGKGQARSEGQLDKLLTGCRARKTAVLPVAADLFDRISDTVNSQGILAVVKQPRWTRARVFAPGRIVVVADQIRDPGNLGTIIRTSAAAGVSGVVLTSGTVDPFNPKTLRATMGAVFRVPVVPNCRPLDIKEWCREAGYALLVADSSGDTVYFDFDMTGSVCLVVGNETSGPDKAFLSWADAVLSIPMPGETESLNAATACAIIVYESIRQRRKKRLLRGF